MADGNNHIFIDVFVYNYNNLFPLLDGGIYNGVSSGSIIVSVLKVDNTYHANPKISFIFGDNKLYHKRIHNFSEVNVQSNESDYSPALKVIKNVIQLANKNEKNYTFKEINCKDTKVCKDKLERDNLNYLYDNIADIIKNNNLNLLKNK